MPMQVECLVVLANGDIAISGGHLRFEVCIYRHDLENSISVLHGGSREKLKLVDSIDTNGHIILHIVELNEQYLLLVSRLFKMLLFRRYEVAQDW